MKTLFTLIALSMVLGFSSWGWKWEEIKGSGHIIKETREIGEFNEIKVSGGIDVILTQGDKQPLTIEGDDNLISYIETQIKENTLVISRSQTKKNFKPTKSIKVYITTPDLQSIEASSASDIQSNSFWKVEHMNIKLSSASDLNLEIEATELQLKASSASDVSLSGNVDTFIASFSSASDLDGKHLQVKKANLSASGASSLSVSVEEELTYRISGASDLTYYGDPIIISSECTSAGSVSHKKGKK